MANSLALNNWMDIPFMDNFDEKGRIKGGLLDYVEELEHSLIMSTNVPSGTTNKEVTDIIKRYYDRTELYTEPVRFYGKSPNFPDLESMNEDLMTENYEIISRLAEIDTCYNCCGCANKEECWGKEPLTFAKFIEWPVMEENSANQVEDCLCDQETSTYESYAYNNGLDAENYRILYDGIKALGYAAFVMPWQLSNMLFNGNKDVVIGTARKIITLNDCQQTLLPAFAEETMYGCSPEAREYRLAITG